MPCRSSSLKIFVPPQAWQILAKASPPGSNTCVLTASWAERLVGAGEDAQLPWPQAPSRKCGGGGCGVLYGGFTGNGFATRPAGGRFGTTAEAGCGCGSADADPWLLGAVAAGEDAQPPEPARSSLTSLGGEYVRHWSGVSGLLCGAGMLPRTRSGPR